MNEQMEKSCRTCKYLFNVVCLHDPVTHYKNKPNVFYPKNCYKKHYKYWEPKQDSKIKGDKNE